ncbi:hypothetical protein HSBAA_38760 [Vreelandella sulfidaeris]|uniref:Uncharacterized protein n=1 Tax=Vreelandella sulfidaeris TaxID=115553 RepID=A0A455U8Q8_9GAMM|nr:hypothetical protein HSBAA_38760 [Halomonas sulfidaeris]
MIVLGLPKTRNTILTNNDIFRRIRYTFDLKDSTIVDIFALAEVSVTQQQVTAWLKKDEDDALSP